MKAVLFKISRILILLVVLSGGCAFLGTMMGDGDLPEFYSIPVEQLVEPVTQNTTFYLADSDIPAKPQERWFAMYHTLRILETVSPEIALWVADRHRRGMLIYDFNIPVDHSAYGTCYAYQSILTGHLLLSPHFWRLSDVEKAGVFVHEYRHSRQNFLKAMGWRAVQIISLRALSDPDDIVLENEAYLYQYQFYQAIRHQNTLVESILKTRELL